MPDDIWESLTRNLRLAVTIQRPPIRRTGMLVGFYQYGLWLMYSISSHYVAAIHAGYWLAFLALPLASAVLILGWLLAMAWPLAPFLVLLSKPRRRGAS